MQDITGAPVSDIQGLPESYKWLAPEELFGDGIMSTRSDIYSFAMTIYEVSASRNWVFYDAESLIFTYSWSRAKIPSQK